MDGKQAANLVGALALRLCDLMQEATTAAAGQGASAASALSVLRHFDVDPSVDLLAKILGLTSSGAVRLVDRLVAAGLVQRGSRTDTWGTDARMTRLRLTARGRRAAGRVTAARAAVLEQALQALTPDERVRLGEFAGRVLAGMVRPPGAVRWTCRLCDTGACGRAEGRCPVATAAGFRPP